MNDNAYRIRIVAAFPDLPERLARARFIAPALELAWLYEGISGDEPSFFVVHIGRARDWLLPD